MNARTADPGRDTMLCMKGGLGSMARKHAQQWKAVRAGASAREALQLHQAVCAD